MEQASDWIDLIYIAGKMILLTIGCAAAISLVALVIFLIFLAFHKYDPESVDVYDFDINTGLSQDETLTKKIVEYDGVSYAVFSHDGEAKPSE